MERDTIEKVEQMTKDSYLVEVGGRKYTATNLHPVIYNPKPSTLTVHNLRGFCGFIKNDIDKLIKGKPHLIVVNDHKSVDLISDVDGEDKKRTILISARINDRLDEFPFGSFLSQEEFAITFRSLFKARKDDDFDYVLSYASKLSGGTQIELEDDGVTQKVAVARGVSGALKDKVALKPIVKLSPYRTFREVEQPQSEFLLRIRLTGEIPNIALFEADGGAWVNDATQNIVAYIESAVSGIPVIA
ncbi:hypothetical protein [Treponema sp. R6D11]